MSDLVLRQARRLFSTLPPPLRARVRGKLAPVERVRHVLSRRRVPLELVPLQQCERAGRDRFVATGEDPAFLLQGPPGALTAGWVSLRLEAGGAYPFAPKLYCDDGSGYSEARSIRLPPPSGGVIEAVVELPRSTRSVRFDPGTGSGELTLRAATVRCFPSGTMRLRGALGPVRRVEDVPAALGSVRRLLAGLDAYERWHVRYVLPVLARLAHEAPLRQPYTVIVDCRGARRRAIDATLRSIQALADPPLQVLRAGEHDTLASALLSTSHPVLLVRAGFLLEPVAARGLLGQLAHGWSCVFADHDRATGLTTAPKMAPRASLFLALARDDLFGGALALSRTARRAIGEALAHAPEQTFYAAALLAVSDDERRIKRVPFPLTHDVRRRSDGASPALVEWVAARAKLSGRFTQQAPGVRRFRPTLPRETPRVSIVIPTRDAVDLVERCVASVREKTRYPSYEIVLVDNQSTEASRAVFAEHERRGDYRVLRYDAPFNYAAINNFAVQQVQSEIVCLLNNDTEVQSEEWLSELVGLLLQPDVGAAGCLLMFGDGSVQHAGVILGLGGIAGHAHWQSRPEELVLTTREWSAVTAACLVTRRSDYLAVGGLDEQHLGVAFNDVDYCLRLGGAGKRVLFSPYVRLFHHESKTRGPDVSGERLARYMKECDHLQQRWFAQIDDDPFYNPNLGLEAPGFALAFPPRRAT